MATEAEFSFLFLYAIFFTARANFDPYSDNNKFLVHFPGDLPNAHGGSPMSTSDYVQDDDSMVIVTGANEKYKCLIPDVVGGDKHGNQANMEGQLYEGPSETELLSSLLLQSSCSYKIEPYWTYELCHNKFIRQYHEEREEKGSKIQEYYLGYHKEKGGDGAEESEGSTLEIKQPMGVKQIGGKDLPYYAVEYDSGTHCELTGQPRRSTVLYICHELGRGEVYELKETSSCNYEVTILTQLLCSHPHYTARKDPLNIINCHSVDQSARRPTNLVNFELENAQARYHKPEDQVYPKTELQKPQESHTPASESQSPESETPKSHAPPKQSSVRHRSATPKGDSAGLTSTDKQLLRDFLSGKYCIQGGTGWWKHEFCYGRKVIQYHQEDSGDRTSIVLGVWDESVHKQWINTNTAKRPKHVSKDNQVVYQYYGNGDICDLTGLPRAVEVKLRCKENPSDPHSVSIYLLETRTCQYHLVVESPILCSVLEKADLDGIISEPPPS